jgi:hypothetical protein
LVLSHGEAKVRLITEREGEMNERGMKSQNGGDGSEVMNI